MNISNQYVVGCNAETEDLCAFGTTDCIIVHENTILHNSTDLSIRLSANAVLTSGQFWGVKDLLIAVKLCFPYCATCYSPLVSQCFSCKTGYYLLGNYCLEKCTTGMYQLNVSNACVSVCPSRYYADSVASSCLDCSVGCLICSSASSCLSYDTGYGQENSTWKNNLPFWILVIVLAAILLAILTGCLVYRCKNGFFPVFQNKKGKKGEEDEGRQMAFKHKISNVSM